MNPHSAYLDKRIESIKNHPRYGSYIINTSHEQFVQDFGSSVFTNLIQSVFLTTYVRKHTCTECDQPAKERCHAPGDERPVLLLRVLNRIWPDTSIPICLRDIVVAFLEEHKKTKFNFKCSECHKKETKLARATKDKAL
jgi:hypothetical protein